MTTTNKIEISAIIGNITKKALISYEQKELIDYTVGIIFNDVYIKNQVIIEEKSGPHGGDYSEVFVKNESVGIIWWSDIFKGNLFGARSIEDADNGGYIFTNHKSMDIAIEWIVFDYVENNLNTKIINKIKIK